MGVGVWGCVGVCRGTSNHSLCKHTGVGVWGVWGCGGVGCVGVCGCGGVGVCGGVWVWGCAEVPQTTHCVNIQNLQFIILITLPWE